MSKKVVNLDGTWILENGFRFVVGIVVTGGNAALERVRRLDKKGVAKALAVGLKDVSEAAAVTLAKEIETGFGRGHETSTQAKYAIRKQAGERWPAMPAYPGAVPLSRSQALARAIVSAKESNLRYAVGVRAGAMGKFSGGRTVSLADIALMQEEGYVRSIPMTLRMNAYLRIIYKGGGRKGRRGFLPDQQTGYTVNVRIPPRPVWRTVFRRYAAPNASLGRGIVELGFFNTIGWS